MIPARQALTVCAEFHRRVGGDAFVNAETLTLRLNVPNLNLSLRPTITGAAGGTAALLTREYREQLSVRANEDFALRAFRQSNGADGSSRRQFEDGHGFSINACLDSVAVRRKTGVRP